MSKNVMTCLFGEAFLSVFVYYVTVINIWNINGV